MTQKIDLDLMLGDLAEQQKLLKTYEAEIIAKKHRGKKLLKKS